MSRLLKVFVFFAVVFVGFYIVSRIMMYRAIVNGDYIIQIGDAAKSRGVTEIRAPFRERVVQ